MSDTMLEIDGLVRHFDKLRAVDDISFNVKRGQVFGFIGPNGAGKTTTMRILATLICLNRAMSASTAFR